MIALRPNEKILLVLRRHWYVMTGPVVGAFFALLLPSLLIFIVGDRISAFSAPELWLVINFFLALYIVGILLYFFMIWADYYLDVWIITSDRLVDINQKGLFVRSISEMNMENIQNVTVEVNGLVPMFLRIGNLKVETAAEGMFVINGVPGFAEAKDILLKYSNEKHKGHL